MVALGALEACKIGDLATLKKLTDVNPNITDANGACCLHYAARGGTVPVVEYLIKEKGFSASLRSNTGATALHDAAAIGNTAVVKWLIENTDLQVGDQDSAGATALHLAARFKHILTVVWLLDEAHANAGARAANDALPIHFAVVGGDMNCVKILIDENPRLINMQINNGTTPVYIACQEGHFDILKFLVSKNGATKIKAYDAMSCLHAAAQKGHLDIVKWLIKEEKCNPNDRDFDGATPLHYAASRGHVDIVYWLLKEGGAKVTLDNLGGSPLHNAAELGEIKTVVALLKAGCDVTLVDNAALTAAELADTCGQTVAAAVIRGEITADQALAATNGQTTNKSRSPHPSFPSPPSYPPDHAETGTSTYSPGSVSPPLPPPPIPASPASSTPQTSGSTISPPTPLSEAEDEITVLESSSVRQYSRPSGGEVAAAKEKVTRTVSVDSTASNFGVFETQSVVVHVVKADVHHTPKHISTNSQPATSTGNHSPAEESRVSSRVSNQEASTYSRPGVVNIYSKPARVSSVKSKQQTQPVVSSPVARGSSLSLSSSSLQSNSSVTSTTSTSSLSSPDSITASPDDSSAGKKLKKPYYTTQYRQDFDTVTKTKFAQVKALFQQGALESEYVCPDSGEVCKREENHLFADKQAPGHIRKMSEQAPPPLPSSQTESDQTLTNGAASVQNGGSKSVVNIHGGHVTIISTGGSSDEIISTASSAANKNTLRPLSGSIALTSGHSGSDNVSALMKELSLRKPPIQVNRDAKPLVNGESSSNNSGHIAMTRPASVHSSVNSARDNVDKSKVNYSRSSSSSSANSQPHSPVDVSNKHNLIADIQSAVSGSSNLSLRRAKNRGEGVNMVYQSRKSTGGITEVKTDHRPLTGQFDPKNFLDQIEKVDASGLVIPEWRRQVLAKHAAEKAQKEYEEKKLFEDNEERFKNVPAWKRAIIEKKEAEAREGAAAALKK